MPAIDIRNGKCVRLYKGLKGTEKVYYENPLDAIKFWITNGAKRIHLIDLDGAWGSFVNIAILDSIIEKFGGKVKIQIGGGIRSIESALNFFKKGVDRIIIGTLAIENPDSILQLIKTIGAEKIIIALDYKRDKIAVEGWEKETDENPFEFAKKIIDLGVINILFTSIEADGTLSGPDFSNIKRMLKVIGIKRLFVAGGVRNKADVLKLKNIGVAGVIIGKSLYENNISVSIFQKSI
ncbi:MAG: 1-(5-phosphoribosyl)-5-[(5-phosphoribosylamino)methylideneamino]imidazole-4-carboxamide isomerase [Candidatus Heimdallarchaeota archaeon]